MTQVNEQLSQLSSEIMSRAIRYTTLPIWQDAVSLGQLIPQTPIAPDFQRGLPEWAYRKHIFAIDENELEKWTKNEQFPNLMNPLMRHVKFGNGLKERAGIRCKVAELSFDIKESDDAHVLDCIHRIDFIYQRSAVKDFKEYIQGYFLGATEQWRKYVGSAVPFYQYERNYSLPEIVISKPISLDRIKLERIFD
jgi:hypothetical protein